MTALDCLSPSPSPLAGTLVDRLRSWATVKPDEAAFYFWLGDETDAERLTYRDLERHARAVAGALLGRGLSGERALLLFPPGLEFATAVFGCFLAGVTVVPGFPPGHSRHRERMQAIADDADAAIILTTHEARNRVALPLARTPRRRSLPWLAIDDVAFQEAAAWEPPSITAETLAVLQYTSGSTGDPKGVMLSHANLMHNCAHITESFAPCPGTGIGLFWLPTYHDMGLIGGVLEPVFCGRPAVLMPPLAFLQRPVRWLRGISRFRATMSGGPNFAYALCNERITPAECAGLDLSSWDVAFTGAEPIRAETLETFTRKFSPYGFRHEAHYPCYGLAEATLFVAGPDKRRPPRVCGFDARALEDHQARSTTTGQAVVRRLVGCGHAHHEAEIVIVDPATGHRLPDQSVGEIWVAGPSVAQGYWNKPTESAETFQARVGAGGRCCLRTGDLGFWRDGELFVTGRLKDLMIVRGRNLYPQDVERTVAHCHPALRPEGCACFSIESDGEERVVVVQELSRHGETADDANAIETIRQAVSEAHEVLLHAVVLIKPRALPRTTSGKVQRGLCRTAFLEDRLEAVFQWREKEDTRVSPGEEFRERRYAPLGLLDASSAGSERRSAGEPRASTVASLRTWIAHRVAERCGCAPDAIDFHQPFARLGLDSLAVVSISGELEAYLGCPVSPTALYSHPTIERLAEHLLGNAPSEENLLIACPQGQLRRSMAPSTNVPEPIAVVGLGCRFPGADGPQALWRMLRDGQDAIVPTPADRWDTAVLYDPEPHAPGKMYTRHGGFLQGIESFDAPFFGIAPREAASMDPQQRLLLEVAWETLEFAGCAPGDLQDSPTGVFVGIGPSDYARLQSSRLGWDDIDAHTALGAAASVAAGRLAYFLGVHGPCLAVDTACSSSLAAIHLAVQSLRRGECQAALAGGVSLMLDPATTIALCRLQALSPDGRCKTFDARADGYGRGEGCGMVLLKRLSDALRDGDRLWAVIRGSAMNHDGRSNGLAAPHGRAQEALLRAALADAGVAPHEVGYVEAHGTGTSLGDPIEVQAIAKILGEGRTAAQPLTLGSVKANLGHLEAAAGVAGLIKTVLTLRHGEIPPQLHFQTPNPLIPWDAAPLQIPLRLTAWPTSFARRIAGVSSFGLSGTNVHVVLEEAAEFPPAKQRPERPAHLLVLSGRQEKSLNELADRYVNYLAEGPAELAQVCYTAATGRTHFPHRLAVVAENAQQVRDRLTGADAAFPSLRGRADERRAPQIAFLFPGDGAQFVGMGRALYESQPTFRRTLDRCDRLLRRDLPCSLLSVLFADAETNSSLQEIRFAEPALFALEYALYELWVAWGVRPDFLLGYGLGEYVAACVAGVFEVETALQLVAARARLLQARCPPGAMAVVAADEPAVQRALDRQGDGVEVAANHGPHETVLAGSSSAMRRAVAVLEGAGLRTKPVKVSRALQSALIEPMLDEWEHECRSVRFAAPKKPIASNLTGKIAAEEMASPQYWRDQLRSPVRLGDGLLTLDAQGADVYLEIGPQAALLPVGRQCLPERHQLWLASLRRECEDWPQLLETLAELYVRGAPIDWRGFDRDYRRVKVALPTYPFQRSRYGMVAKPLADAPLARNSDPSPPASVSDASPGALRSALAIGLIEDRVRCAEWYLKQQVGRVLDLAADAIAADKPLQQLGVDSLMAVELRNRVQAELDVDLRIAQLLHNPTIAQLAHLLVKLLDDPAQQAETRESSPKGEERDAQPHRAPTKLADAHATTPTQPISSLESLTDDEVDAMLRQLLADTER